MKTKSYPIAIVLIVLVSCPAISDWVEDFDVVNPNDYEFAGNCDQCGFWLGDESEFLITPPEGSHYGRIVYLVEHSLGAFDARIDFKLEGNADGIVFVWTVDPWAGFTEGGGGGLNWEDGVGFGVEVDLYPNYQDPETPHIALMKDGCYSGNVLAWSSQPSVNNGLWHSLHIVNDLGHVMVYLDDMAVIDTIIEDYIPEVGYFRISGSTGAAYADQRIDNVLVHADLPVSQRTASWGLVKALY